MSNPKVTLPEGSIQGCCRKDINGEEFLCFEGIPYGEPPVGELRFKVSLTHDNCWYQINSYNFFQFIFVITVSKFMYVKSNKMVIDKCFRVIQW